MYVITGATGHTGRIITEKLLSEGKRVRIISRSEEKAKDLVKKGAELVIGNQLSSAPLVHAFKDATAIYAMIAMDWTVRDYYAHQKKCADTIAEAVEKTKVKYVVTLSSIGVQLEENTGLISGLHYMENRFNKIPNLNVLHLRPTYFMENTLIQADMIQQTGNMGSPIKSNLKIPMIATQDVGEYAAKRLRALNFLDINHQYLLGERDITYSEIAKVYGKAIDKPDIKYIETSYESLKYSVLSMMGATENVADNLVQFIQLLNSGRLFMGARRNKDNTTHTSIERFAKTFAHAYNIRSRQEV
jgi:uncharacterized protein YbjT (DUF2867 family)